MRITTKRILVIDDEWSVRQAVRLALESAGYEIIEAANGEVGLVEAKGPLPDLILCDVSMPRLGGRGTLQALRHDPRLKKIPIIFISGLPSEGEPRRSMAAQAEGYLVKPFKLDELLEAVQRCMGQEHVASDGPAKES